MPFRNPQKGKADIAQRNRQYIRECKELGKCKVCSESRTVCLVYHHCNPDYKLFEIGEAGGRSLEAIYQEMQKCDLVCANCHLVIHAKSRLEVAIKDDSLPLFESGSN